MCSSISGSTSFSFTDGESPGENISDFWSVSPRDNLSPLEPSIDELPGVLDESAMGPSPEVSLAAIACDRF